jgi:hypothetical protein
MNRLFEKRLLRRIGYLIPEKDDILAIDMAISDVSGKDEPTAVCVTSTAILLTTPNPRGAVVTAIPAIRISETRMRAPGAIEVEYREDDTGHTTVVVLDFRYFGEDDGSTTQIEDIARAHRS